MDKLMNNEWPDHDIKAHVFGLVGYDRLLREKLMKKYRSSVNELGTVSSDIDLCITTPWNGLRNVKTLAKLFRKCKVAH